METMEVLSIVSLTVAVIAILLSIIAARDARTNYDRTKEVLADIETKASLIEQMVSSNQTELLNTVRDLVIPAKPDMGEQIGVELMKAMMSDPEKFEQMMPTLMKFSEQQQPPSSS